MSVMTSRDKRLLSGPDHIGSARSEPRTTGSADQDPSVKQSPPPKSDMGSPPPTSRGHLSDTYEEQNPISTQVILNEIMDLIGPNSPPTVKGDRRTEIHEQSVSDMNVTNHKDPTKLTMNNRTVSGKNSARLFLDKMQSPQQFFKGLLESPRTPIRRAIRLSDPIVTPPPPPPNGNRKAHPDQANVSAEHARGAGHNGPIVTNSAPSNSPTKGRIAPRLPVHIPHVTLKGPDWVKEVLSNGEDVQNKGAKCTRNCPSPPRSLAEVHDLHNETRSPPSANCDPNTPI